MADDESESGMESGWESDGGNELRMAARLGQQLLRQKQELAARLEVVDKENERLRDRYRSRGTQHPRHLSAVLPLGKPMTVDAPASPQDRVQHGSHAALRSLSVDIDTDQLSG
jgi:hypothetical protein